ncbi:MAG: tRNA (cytidine(34)-2'-O)-methyltransferase [Candidatus Sumerlaeia bacterium]|nr:tRNA (cytidine(34)-2'-O)-methyltransferase [Candidatus Sumerlaeia bacterium]
MEVVRAPRLESPSGLELVLYSPRIPQNVGAIGRLCATTSTPMHVIRPITFPLDDRALRRSAMDYWDHVHLTLHDGFRAFRDAMPERRIWLFSTRGQRLHWDTEFQLGDVLLFGNEAHGVPENIHAELGPERVVRLPQGNPHTRSLNLAMAAAVALFEAMRRVQAAGS